MADDLEHLTQQFHQLNNAHGQIVEELKGLKVHMYAFIMLHIYISLHSFNCDCRKFHIGYVNKFLHNIYEL